MKMKYAILLLSVMTYTLAYCGDGDEHPFKRVYIGVSATPLVSYRYEVNNYVPNGGSSSSNQTQISFNNKYAGPLVGVGAAAKLGINLTHWLAVESGIGYSFIRYQENLPASLVAPVGIMPYDNVKYVYNYMAVPLGLRFSMGHRKVRGVIAAGVDFDFLLNEKTVQTNTEVQPNVKNVTTQTGSYKTFDLSPYLGIGIDCYMSPAAVLRIMPVAQIQSLKDSNQPISDYLWNAGLNFQFLFGL